MFLFPCGVAHSSPSPVKSATLFHINKLVPVVNLLIFFVSVFLIVKSLTELINRSKNFYTFFIYFMYSLKIWGVLFLQIYFFFCFFKRPYKS